MDRRRAEKQRLAEIERLAQIAREDRIADVLGYEGAGVDVRGIPAVEGQLPGPWSRENMAEQPFGPLGEGVERRVGPPERPTRGALEVLDRPELRGTALAAKFRREDKLERERKAHAARLLLDKYEHEKGLLSAKQIADDFKADFDATKAHLEALAAGGKTEIPLFRLSSFREGETKRLSTFFDTAVEKYNTASVDQRDEEWKERIRVLAPYAATQTGFEMPSLPEGSRISSEAATGLWNAHRLGEGEIVGARARDARTLEKEFGFEDLAEAKSKVEDRLEGKVREFVGLTGNDWNEQAQRIHDELMDRIRVPDDAWTVYGKMEGDVDNQRLLDSVKDSDFFAEEARNLVKVVMADPFLRTNPVAMRFLMKNISPEKTSAWRKQFAEWKTLKTKRDAAKSNKAKAEIQEEMDFIHRKANPFEKDSTKWMEVLQRLEEMGSGGDGSPTPPAEAEKPLEIPPLPGDQGVPKKEAVPPDAKPLPPGAKVTAEGVIIGNVTYPIGEPLGNEGGPKHEIIIINGKPYQRPVK